MNHPNPDTAARRVKKLSKLRPTIAMVLGSGFHHLLQEMAIDARISYEKIPGFPPTGVSGHAGELLVGKIGATPVMVLSGRAHYYEGHPLAVVTFPVRALAAYGIRDLLLTNAAGAINPRFRAGDFMMLTDHINLMGDNPLRSGQWPELNRFVDLTSVYDPDLRHMLTQAATRCRLRLRSGVYLAVSGPSYETPAEIRAFKCLGADAVGMSTVPEAIVARQCRLRVAGLSCLTNLASNSGNKPLSHTEVLETAQRVQSLAAQLLRNFCNLYGQSH